MTWRWPWIPPIADHRLGELCRRYYSDRPVSEQCRCVGWRCALSEGREMTPEEQAVIDAVVRLPNVIYFKTSGHADFTPEWQEVFSARDRLRDSRKPGRVLSVEDVELSCVTMDRDLVIEALGRMKPGDRWLLWNVKSE